jgi:ParB-like chromosome segregation protein Spo0J
MTTDLRVEVVPIDALTPDPTNARKHSRKNLDAIAGSLRQFGQRRALVVYGDVVIAGNGTLEAARSLGWTEIAVTRVPRDWSPEQARAYALADNRTAELAEWDSAVLADQLIELDAVGFDLSEFGFAQMEPPTGDDDDTDPQLGETKYAVIIDCADELQQAELLHNLAAQGLAVRPLML